MTKTAEKRGRGRPRVPADLRQIMFRFGPEQFEHLEQIRESLQAEYADGSVKIKITTTDAVKVALREAAEKRFQK